MFICESCGKTFEESKRFKESHGFTDGFYESIYVCPHCYSSEYKEATVCGSCGEWFDEDKVFGGFCSTCLKEECDHQNAVEYIAEEKSYLRTFFFDWMMASTVPRIVGEELDWHIREALTEMVEAEKQSGGTVILDKMREYILVEDGAYGRSDFADWLVKKGGEKNAEKRI